jgi:uncharacterized protein (UPF0333 family)
MLSYLTKRRKKGQSTLEYAILIIIIIGALISIQVYIKRGIQGRLKGASDDIGTQFDPGNSSANIIRRTRGQSEETFLIGVTRSQLLQVERTDDMSNVAIVNDQFTFWGT